jgi:hypothetical protein
LHKGKNPEFRKIPFSCLFKSIEFFPAGLVAFGAIQVLVACFFIPFKGKSASTLIKNLAISKIPHLSISNLHN